MNSSPSLANNVTVSIGDITMSNRMSFSLVPTGDAFKFLGNPIQFHKLTDFTAQGYQNGGSFLVSAIHLEFRIDSLVDVIDCVNVNVVK
jgi:hypothetical protein